MAIQEIAADYRTQIEHPDVDETRHRFDADSNLIYAYFGV